MNEPMQPSLRFVARMCSSGRAGKLVETSVAIEMFLVILLQQAGAGEPAVEWFPEDPPHDLSEDKQRKPPDDPVAHVKPGEIDDFLGGLIECLVEPL